MMARDQTDPKGNVGKYTSKNPIKRLVIRRFLNQIAIRLERTHAVTALDVGCGEGHVIASLHERLPSVRLVGLDYGESVLRHPLPSSNRWEMIHADAFSLPFRDRSVEAILCLEVLEHLSEPSQALREIARVCGHYAIFSVPNEPWFRLANLAGLNNVRALGNDPGHIQHWSIRSFARLVASHFRLVEIATSFPWSIVVAERDEELRRD
jgi:2-polyprenyl-3-methyl-5-hydroxy-6-metoxy-1,4-benzoquinol methylase